MVGLRPSLSESWAPDVEPALDFGELDRDPLRTLVQPGHRGPGHAIGEARVLGGLEQHVELPVGRQPQTGPGQLLSVPIEDRPPLSWRTFAVKPFEATNRIADIRGEESEAKVAAVLADLGQQRVSGATNVQLGDEVCRRRDAWPVALSFERVVAEILINLPE